MRRYVCIWPRMTRTTSRSPCGWFQSYTFWGHSLFFSDESQFRWFWCWACGTLTELPCRSLTPVTRGSLTGKYAFNTAAGFLWREIPPEENLAATLCLKLPPPAVKYNSQSKRHVAFMGWYISNHQGIVVTSLQKQTFGLPCCQISLRQGRIRSCCFTGYQGLQDTVVPPSGGRIGPRPLW